MRPLAAKTDRSARATFPDRGQPMSVEVYGQARSSAVVGTVPSKGAGVADASGSVAGASVAVGASVSVSTFGGVANAAGSMR
nr:hypothetical protein [Cryobacterium roopkundense]